MNNRFYIKLTVSYIHAMHNIYKCAKFSLAVTPTMEGIVTNQPIQQPHHEHILNILSNKDEITWQAVLYELVKSEQMDPWDIDVSLLSHKYIGTLKKLKEFDMALSGKVVLAAAILLKIKSKRLITEDIDAFDNLLSGQDEESLYDGQPLDEHQRERMRIDGIGLIPKTPQPRKRKVSIFELVDALRLALDTDRRRLLRIRPVEMVLPQKTWDISDAMRSIYSRIVGFFTGDEGGKLTFDQLVPDGSKKDKIQTFLPLLHLTTQRKIDLFQDVPFGEIEIRLNADKQVEKELGELG